MTFAIEAITVVKDNRELLREVSIAVEPGEVTALLGANGAGKSELVLAAAGMLPIASGSITADGRQISGLRPDAVRAAGVAAVPEGHRVLSRLSVADNLRAAGSVLPRSDVEAQCEHVFALFPELAERRRQLAGTMSGGQQQMLAIGHALMSRPRYLLIDEMSLGLAPLIVKRLLSAIDDIRSEGTGVILVEQFTELALQVASRAVVLRTGRQVFSGDAATLREQPEILNAAYL